MRNIFLLISTLALATSCGINNKEQKERVALADSLKGTFWDYTLSIDERVDDLVSKMTLEEKTQQMMHNAPAIERLGIPAYNWWSEALHGVARSGKATVFPQPIGMAATWDTELIEEISSAIGDEARAKFNAAIKEDNRTIYSGLTFWSPNINIFRDPRWGRGMETWGEDPYLTGEMGAAFVRGLQGDNPDYLKAAACAKHYAVHSGPEALRHEFNAVPSKKDFYETYLPAFEKLVKESNVEAVMCAYNRTYDEACCGSKYMLTDILRSDWGFKGHIVTDCGAVTDIYATHKNAKDMVGATALSVKSGVNLNCGTEFKTLKRAVEQRLITEQELDEGIKPLFRTRFKLGLLDPEDMVPFNKISYDVVNCKEHKELAYEAALKSVVLLKNNGVLPLKGVKNFYITGPNAADVDVLFGNYNGYAPDMVTILEGFMAKVKPGVGVGYRKGFLLNEPNKNPINYGLWEARGAGACVVVMGVSPLLEGEEGESLLSAEKSDRSNITLPKSQIDFLKELRDNKGKPLIVILTGGSPIAIPEVCDIADAVLFVWYPGEQGGNAVADIVLGNASPSGKLPITFPKSVDQLPKYDDYSMVGRTYKYMTEEPQFPFGFGLSYATFEYSNIKTDKKEYARNDTVRLSVLVKNTGTIESEEVSQLYVTDMEAGFRVPLFDLKSFKRISLKPGESKQIDFALSASDLSGYNNDGDFVFESGKFKLSVGGALPIKRSVELGASKYVETEILMN